MQSSLNQAEQRQVQHAGGKAGEQKLAEDGVDARRVPQGMEVGGVVLLGIVDGLDGQFQNGQAVAGLDEHVALELKALARHVHQPLHE